MTAYIEATNSSPIVESSATIATTSPVDPGIAALQVQIAQLSETIASQAQQQAKIQNTSEQMLTLIAQYRDEGRANKEHSDK